MATTAPDSKTIVLITGANRGIGFEIAKILATSPDKPYHIILSSRHNSSVESAITTLRSLPNLNPSTTLEPLALDLTSDTSISSAAAQISTQHGHLDILIHNAAISFSSLSTHVTDPHAPQRERENWHAIFDTNLIGPALLTDALLPLLSSSSQPERKMVFVSSKLGSITYTFDEVNSRHIDLSDATRFTEYSASKAALNLYAKHLAWRLEHSHGEHGGSGSGKGEEDQGGEKGGEKGEEKGEGKDGEKGAEKGGDEKKRKWKVNVVCPGYTKTGLNNYQGTQEPSEAAKIVVRVVEEEGGETGTFRDKDGAVSW